MNKKIKRILILGISISAIICITLHILFTPNNVEEVLWDLFDGKEYENTDFEMSELIYLKSHFWVMV